MKALPREFVRQSDHPIWWVLLLLGLAMIAAAVVLRSRGMISEGTATAWIGVAAFVARPDQVLDFIRAKRARSHSGGEYV